MISLLLACRGAVLPEAPTPTTPIWFDVEPGKPLCVSRFPDAPPLSADETARFDAAVAAVARGEYAAGVDGLAALPGSHPAVEGALALVGLLVDQPESTATLLRLSDEHPGDACALVGAALAAAAHGDVPGARDRVLRARELAPDAGNVTVVSWYMELEPPEVIRPALEAALAADPANPGPRPTERRAPGGSACAGNVRSDSAAPGSPERC